MLNSWPGTFAPNLKAEAFVRKHPDYERVGLVSSIAGRKERQLGWLLELHGHFGHPDGESLARPHVHRNPGPTPVVDGEAKSHERLGRAERVDPSLLPVPGHRIVPGPAPGVLTPNRGEGRVLRLSDREDGPEELDLLVAYGLWMK